LLDAAEKEGFAVLVTADCNLKYQQNLTSRRIAIVGLSTTSWPRIQRAVAAVIAAVDGATAGTYAESTFREDGQQRLAPDRQTARPFGSLLASLVGGG
jgi:hypothetical protein